MLLIGQHFIGPPAKMHMPIAWLTICWGTQLDWDTPNASAFAVDCNRLLCIQIFSVSQVLCLGRTADVWFPFSKQRRSSRSKHYLLAYPLGRSSVASRIVRHIAVFLLMYIGCHDPHERLFLQGCANAVSLTAWSLSLALWSYALAAS